MKSLGWSIWYQMNVPDYFCFLYMVGHFVSIIGQNKSISCLWANRKWNYLLTRTAGAAGPLVLESGSSMFFCFVFFFFVFYHTNFCSNLTIFQFHHKFHHKCLPQVSPQTTTTNHYHNWVVNIYYHTNFCSNPTIFKFYTNFTTHFYHIFYHKFYHKLLPQTTIIIGESISTTTPIFVPIRQFFNFTTHVTTDFTTNPYHYLLTLHNVFCTLEKHFQMF